MHARGRSGSGCLGRTLAGLTLSWAPKSTFRRSDFGKVRACPSPPRSLRAAATPELGMPLPDPNLLFQLFQIEALTEGAT